QRLRKTAALGVAAVVQLARTRVPLRRCSDAATPFEGGIHSPKQIELRRGIISLRDLLRKNTQHRRRIFCENAGREQQGNGKEERPNHLASDAMRRAMNSWSFGILQAPRSFVPFSILPATTGSAAYQYIMGRFESFWSSGYPIKALTISNRCSKLLKL